MWQAYEKDGVLNEHQTGRLEAINTRDGIFADIDPGLWATGAKAERVGTAETVAVASTS